MAERKNLTNRALRKRFRLQAFNRIVNLGAYSRAVVALVSPALRLHPRCFLWARDKCRQEFPRTEGTCSGVTSQPKFFAV